MTRTSPPTLFTFGLLITACAASASPGPGSGRDATANEDAPIAIPDGGGAQRDGGGPALADAGSNIIEASEVPPTGEAAVIAAWIERGLYRAWSCEAASHDPRPPSGHSPNRVCSNGKASAHGDGEYPVGSASVKELFDDAGENVVGHAIALKVANGQGEAWYWFEQIGTQVIANGLGDTGTARSVCARCHARAGAALFGHDMVFTQVRP